MKKSSKIIRARNLAARALQESHNRPRIKPCGKLYRRKGRNSDPSPF